MAHVTKTFMHPVGCCFFGAGAYSAGIVEVQVMAGTGTVQKKRAVGVGLFVMYALVFGGFLGLNVFLPEVMAGTTVELPGERVLTLHGVNLAVVYGLGLIVGAFLLAVYYAWRRRGET